MAEALQSDPMVKRLVRDAYVQSCGLAVLVAGMTQRQKALAVWYGGARQGNIGGPLVKVKRLQEYFPEVKYGYNLLYTLSNTPYLPAWALAILKRRRIPIVQNQNGVFYPGWFAGDWAAQNRRMGLAYHAADWVFYQSNFCRIAADRFLGERTGPGEVLYNAIDTQHFSPVTVPESMSEDKARGCFEFLLTGKIGRHLYYRLQSTIAGLKVARDAGLNASLHVAGWVDVQAQRDAEYQAASLGLTKHVRFSGPYTQEQAPEIYRKADAYVMTKHNDPCPNTVLEALACGLPVLYSNTGGVSELVGESAGIAVTCPPHDPWGLPVVPSAKDIGTGMLAIAERQSEFVATARQRAVDLFDISHWINRHRDVFERLLLEQA
jgi:glycosyltransferase involved in cell wall biosynthesis